MSTRTTYYNLTKPDAGEHVLRTVINQNYDAIDLQMHANAQAAEEAAHISADEHDENASYIKGDFCIYENTLYKANKDTSGPFTAADWDATTIADAFEPKHTWRLFETITADGNEYRYTRDIPTNADGVLLICYFKATTQTATHFRALLSSDGATYKAVVYLGSAVTNSDRYGRGEIIREGLNYWKGVGSLSPAEGGIGNVTQLTNGYLLNETPTKIRLETTASTTKFESGSTFEIYIRR